MTEHGLRELAEKLRALDERELILVLSRVLPRFDPYQDEPEVERSGFFLGVYCCNDANFDISLVAYPDPEEYGDAEIGPQWGLCQSAESELSGIEYVSNFKRCISPLTGEKIRLT